MAYKRKKSGGKRYLAKRRPVRRPFRKMSYGSYKKKGKGRRTNVTVRTRSLGVPVWMGNPSGSDYVASYVKPWVSGTDVLADQYVYITNSPYSLTLPLINLTNFNRYKGVFEFMYVSSMWLKYTPAITEGSLGHNLNEVGMVGGAVAGQLTIMPTNDLDKDKENYPVSDLGLHSLKSNVRSTTFSIYKPCFMKWTPKLKVDIAEGPTNVTRYIPMKVQCDTDNWISGSQIGVIIQAQVPFEAGVEYNSLNPLAGGNWPMETTTAVIGKFEMGATCHFYGLRI